MDDSGHDSLQEGTPAASVIAWTLSGPVGFVSRAAFQIGMAQLSQTKIESGVWNQESIETV